MADFERNTMVGVEADLAFAFLSDPRRIPEYVATVTHVESIAIDGDPNAEVDAAERREAGEARFFADTKTRRIEWGRPGTAYSGSIDIETGTIPDTSQVTIRLRTSDESDRAQIERVLDQTVRNIQRLLSGR